MSLSTFCILRPTYSEVNFRDCSARALCYRPITARHEFYVKPFPVCSARLRPSSSSSSKLSSRVRLDSTIEYRV